MLYTNTKCTSQVAFAVACVCVCLWPSVLRINFLIFNRNSKNMIVFENEQHIFMLQFIYIFLLRIEISLRKCIIKIICSKQLRCCFCARGLFIGKLLILLIRWIWLGKLIKQLALRVTRYSYWKATTLKEVFMAAKFSHLFHFEFLISFLFPHLNEMICKLLRAIYLHFFSFIYSVSLLPHRT